MNGEGLRVDLGAQSDQGPVAEPNRTRGDGRSSVERRGRGTAARGFSPESPTVRQ